MILASASIIVGFVVLMWAADRFVTGAAAIARNFGLSPLLIGLTIVAIGTSAPELFVSFMAAWENHTGLAVGNAIGSNIANIGLVLGLTAIICPLRVKSETLRREFPVMIFIMLLGSALLLDGNLNRFDASVLLVTFIAMMAWFVQMGRKHQKDDPMEQEYQDEIPQNMPTKRALFWLIIGLVLLPISSNILIDGSITVAKFFGVSDLVIGLTIVAIGTSLPEVAASVMGAIKKEPDIAVGNIIGSNMFNMVAVLMLPGFIQPGVIDRLVIYRDLPVMLGISLLCFLFAYGFHSRNRITRVEGGVLLLGYVGYMGLLFATI